MSLPGQIQDLTNFYTTYKSDYNLATGNKYPNYGMFSKTEEIINWDRNSSVLTESA